MNGAHRHFRFRHAAAVALLIAFGLSALYLSGVMRSDANDAPAHTDPPRDFGQDRKSTRLNSSH